MMTKETRAEGQWSFTGNVGAWAGIPVLWYLWFCPCSHWSYKKGFCEHCLLSVDSTLWLYHSTPAPNRMLLKA